MRPQRLEVLEDRTAGSACDEGFLRVRRLRVRHVYPDGSASPAYACDVVSRRGVDAVAAVIWHRDSGGRVQVVLKEGVRPPVWLRREQTLVRPDPGAPLLLCELVAGVLEAGDEGSAGLARRAAAEAREEAGLAVPPEAFRPLGGPCFPSPGITDEQVHFVAAEIGALPPEDAGPTDGSGMEHGTRRVVMDLEDALAACRHGRLQDMKTEVGLFRLADLLEAREGRLATGPG